MREVGREPTWPERRAAAVPQPAQVPEAVADAAAGQILALQQSAGNAAVLGMLAGGAAGLIQRQRDAGVDAGPGPTDAGSLPGGTGVAVSPAEALYSEYLEAQMSLDDFRRESHKITNHQPSTGLGLFDAEYVPNTSRLEITLKLKFSFTSGARSDWPTAPAAELTWTPRAQAEFQANFISTVRAAWSGKHTFYCQKDWWETLSADVALNVVAVDKDEHFAVNVVKIPARQFRQSSVTSPFFGGFFGGGTADFDSEDLTPTDKPGGKQRAAVHETGHMLGLGDEYEEADSALGRFFEGSVKHEDLVSAEFGHGVARGPDDRIMSGGERIMPEHGVTFLEALKDATSVGWAHERKTPREVPPDPHAPPAATPTPTPTP
jgi:hypothetical protein